MLSHVESLLAPEILLSVRELWFQHLSGTDIVLPRQEAVKIWFMGGELDQICMQAVSHI